MVAQQFKDCVETDGGSEEAFQRTSTVVKMFFKMLECNCDSTARNPEQDQAPMLMRRTGWKQEGQREGTRMVEESITIQVRTKQL